MPQAPCIVPGRFLWRLCNMFQIRCELIGHYSQPGMSIGLVESADAKHSTLAASESDEARKAPSAACSVD